MLHGIRAAVAAVAVGLFVFPISSARAAIPTPDHLVIVIEENESENAIIGNTANAPYINQLAGEGVSFTNFFGTTHPSEPNYLHMFSGAGQGVIDDSTPTNVPFNTPNLGAALIN